MLKAVEGKNMNVRVMPGWNFTCRKAVGSGWEWSIKLWRGVIAEGREESQKEARVALRKALGEAMLKSADGSLSKAPFRQDLKYYYEKRPWLVKAVLLLMLDGTAEKEIYRVADEEEKFYHHAERVLAGWKPFRLHPLSKPADVVAQKVYRAITGLGWKPRKIREWGLEAYGPRFLDLKVLNISTWDEDGNVTHEPAPQVADDWMPEVQEED